MPAALNTMEKAVPLSFTTAVSTNVGDWSDGCWQWVLGSPSGDPADATRPGMGWTRPFAAAGYAGTHAAPHDIWLMAQPLVSPNRDSHIFVADGSVWQLPLYRLAGLHSPANVEFSTIEFQVASLQPLAYCA